MRNPAIRETETLTLSQRALCRVVDDEAVILDLDSGEYFGLNAVGTRIWQLLGEGRPLAAVRAALVDEFEVGEAEASQDLAEFVEELIEKGLLERMAEA